MKPNLNKSIKKNHQEINFNDMYGYKGEYNHNLNSHKFNRNQKDQIIYIDSNNSNYEDLHQDEEDEFMKLYAVKNHN